MQAAYEQKQPKIAYDFPAINDKNFKHLREFASEGYHYALKQEKYNTYQYGKDVSNDPQGLGKYKKENRYLENMSNAALLDVRQKYLGASEHDRERKFERMAIRAAGTLGFAIGAGAFLVGTAAFVAGIFHGKVGAVELKDLPYTSTVIAALGATAMKYTRGFAKMLFKKDDLDQSPHLNERAHEVDKLLFMRHNGEPMTRDVLRKKNGEFFILDPDLNRLEPAETENTYTADILESTSGTTEALFKREGSLRTQKTPYMKETIRWAQQFKTETQKNKI